jgi:hypothetical protein
MVLLLELGFKRSVYVSHAARFRYRIVTFFALFLGQTLPVITGIALTHLCLVRFIPIYDVWP